ncbi:MAG: SGNH/GDSL hydrolase family protein [Solirubrobacteraceae bacterium]
MNRATSVAALLAVATLTGCGSAAAVHRTARTDPSPNKAIVAALGDSITAGSPLWDPSPAIRLQIGPHLSVQSQYEYWAQRLLGNYVTFRNCGVFGERTDQIAKRLGACAVGARYLIIQGGINDIAQGRPVSAAAADLRQMVVRGKSLGLRVALAELLPWNNGGPAASLLIGQLNASIDQIGRDENVPVYAFYHALEDPLHPGLMRPTYTMDGDHPSVSGYRILGNLVSLP